MNHPDITQRFVGHVLEYSSNPTFQLLLGSHNLFLSYIRQLSKDTDGTFSSRFNEVVQTSSTNPFRDLHHFLLPNIPYMEPEIEITEEDIGSIAGYERVLIYGGRFSTPVKERLMAASRVPIKIYDVYATGSLLPMKNDLVICLSSPNSHQDYYRIKSYCKRHRDEGIVFLHFNQRGFDPLVNLIRERIGGAN